MCVANPCDDACTKAVDMSVDQTGIFNAVTFANPKRGSCVCGQYLTALDNLGTHFVGVVAQTGAYILGEIFAGSVNVVFHLLSLG